MCSGVLVCSGISTNRPVATRRNFPLAISDVDHLFLYHKCNKTVPFRPKGGEVYVFRPDDSSEIMTGSRMYKRESKVGSKAASSR